METSTAIRVCPHRSCGHRASNPVRMETHLVVRHDAYAPSHPGPLVDIGGCDDPACECRFLKRRGHTDPGRWYVVRELRHDPQLGGTP